MIGLARELGCTLRELQARMTSAEISEQMAYDILERRTYEERQHAQEAEREREARRAERHGGSRHGGSRAPRPR